MALSTIPLPYGLRDIKLVPYTSDAALTLGTLVDLPNARTLSFSEAEEFTELRGDDQVVTTRGQGAAVEWSLEAGGLSFEALKIMAGGTVTETGVTPAAKKTFKKLSSNSRPFFQIEGQAISDSGGDVHCRIPLCRTTGNIEGEFGDGAFFLTAGEGAGLPSRVVADLGLLYEFTQNETAINIATA